MSAVGLTAAMRARLLLVAQGQNILQRDWEIVCAQNFAAMQCGFRMLTERGFAALRAPRMTQAEYEVMCAMDQAKRQGAALWTHDGQWSRRHRLCYRKGWAIAGELTPSGLKALNDVRAATGSELYKDMP